MQANFFRISLSGISGFITGVGGKYRKCVKSRNLIGLKLRHSGKYTPVFPAANSYSKMLANVDVKSKWNVFFYVNKNRHRQYEVLQRFGTKQRNHKKTRVINHIITVYFGKYLQIFDLSQYFPRKLGKY